MAKQPHGPKEFLRKRIVALKRKPQLIPMVVLGLAFIWYSFNLTSVSNTTALINGPHMGLAGFATMLFSLLSLVCFMNSFPHRKKVNIPMLVLTCLMIALLIFCDFYYKGRIVDALTRAENQIVLSEKNTFVPHAQHVIEVHEILLLVGAGLLALLPVYSKLIRGINTSVNVEENDSMGKLDLADGDA